jgi:hypothetical protein
VLHKCANPACSNPFRHLDRGKLFQVEMERFGPAIPRKDRFVRRMEYYWLCDECAPLLTLTFEKGRGMITVPLPHAVGKKAATALPLSEIRAVNRSNGNPKSW